MLRLPLLAIAVILQLATLANEATLLLSKAISRKLVEVKAQSVGGYTGKCISLQVGNATPSYLNVLVDNALIFKPDDSSYQDLVVTGGQYLALAPNEIQTVQLYAFCGKSYASCPRASLNYTLKKIGDTTMKTVARFINDHRLYNYMGQHAIWSLTNKHPLTGIYDSRDTGLAMQLIKYIAKAQNRSVPRYFTTHKMPASTGGAVYDPRIDKYIVVVEWNFTPNRNIHVLVHDDKGNLMWEEHKAELSSRGTKVTVELDPQKIAKGNYAVLLRDDDNTVYQKYELEVI